MMNQELSAKKTHITNAINKYLSSLIINDKYKKLVLSYFNENIDKIAADYRYSSDDFIVTSITRTAKGIIRSKIEEELNSGNYKAFLELRNACIANKHIHNIEIFADFLKKTDLEQLESEKFLTAINSIPSLDKSFQNFLKKYNTHFSLDETTPISNSCRAIFLKYRNLMKTTKAQNGISKPHPKPKEKPNLDELEQILTEKEFAVIKSKLASETFRVSKDITYSNVYEYAKSALKKIFSSDLREVFYEYIMSLKLKIKAREQVQKIYEETKEMHQKSTVKLKERPNFEGLEQILSSNEYLVIKSRLAVDTFQTTKDIMVSNASEFTKTALQKIFNSELREPFYEYVISLKLAKRTHKMVQKIYDDSEIYFTNLVASKEKLDLDILKQILTEKEFDVISIRLSNSNFQYLTSIKNSNASSYTKSALKKIFSSDLGEAFYEYVMSLDLNKLTRKSVKQSYEISNVPTKQSTVNNPEKKLRKLTEVAVQKNDNELLHLLGLTIFNQLSAYLNVLEYNEMCKYFLDKEKITEISDTLTLGLKLVFLIPNLRDTFLTYLGYLEIPKEAMDIMLDLHVKTEKLSKVANLCAKYPDAEDREYIKLLILYFLDQDFYLALDSTTLTSEDIKKDRFKVILVDFLAEVSSEYKNNPVDAINIYQILKSIKEKSN